jgi:hypothetical protein
MVAGADSNAVMSQAAHLAQQRSNVRPTPPLSARVIYALSVPLELLRSEVHLAQVAGGVTLGFIIEVL